MPPVAELSQAARDVLPEIWDDIAFARSVQERSELGASWREPWGPSGAIDDPSGVLDQEVRWSFEQFVEADIFPDLSFEGLT